MQNIYDLKLYTFNLTNHSEIDIILDELNVILIFYFKKPDDFQQNFYRLTKASLRFQNIHVILEDSSSLKFLL